MTTKLENFTLQKDIDVFFNNNTESAFNYSDGNVTEERIFNIINHAKDLSLFSDELIGNISDWATEYHFSPLRHNLLRHFKFNSNHKILELGCGCGAITRQIGESGASVTAIEGSKQRAKCAASRTRDLSNVNVYCSDFQKIEFDNEFDYVTLIGVLEYATVFFPDEDPLSACLDIVKSALKPDGKLIVAIENRLGLKYFMGCSEDHGGAPFSGIQDLYNEKTAKTLGREELISLLEKSKFESIEFQYPFPDYKIPEVVFFEKAFKSNSFMPSDIISQMKSRDYSGNYTPLFSETLVWPIIASNKLLSDLSNSFLVVSSLRTTNIDVEKSRKLIAIKYSVDRKVEYNTITEFIENKDETISVEKKKILNSSSKNNNIQQKLVSDIYYTGTNLDLHIVQAIKHNNFNLFVDKLNLWINFLKENAISELNKNIFLSKVLPNYIDCIPKNIIVTKEGLKYIDREWELEVEFTLTTLIRRYVKMLDPDFIDDHIQGSSKNSYDNLLYYLEIPFNKSLKNEFDKIEEIISTTYSKNEKYHSVIRYENKFKRLIFKLFNKLPRTVKQVVFKLKRFLLN